MNKAKNGNYGKLAAFFLVAVIFLCAFGFAAEGWQTETPNEPDSGDVVPGEDDGADENKDGLQDNTQAPEIPEIYVPEHVNPLTGLECDKSTAFTAHTAFTFDTGAPMYGISYADVAIEFPVEDGATRLLAFISDIDKLGKVGSLAPTRGYISNLALPFGARLVALGSDDSINYEYTDVSGSFLNLSESSGYHYTEYTHFNYSNGHLIKAGLSSKQNPGAPSLPYRFTDFGADKTSYRTTATSVTIPYSKGSETELKYSDKDSKYCFGKNGVGKSDLLTDKAVTFDNVFILFADTITYETAVATQMVMDTVSGGSGYYLTGGTSAYITWSVDESGNYLFADENGEMLTVNRGSSYIGFVKSSMSAEVKIS